jgi:hypothetical protein
MATTKCQNCPCTNVKTYYNHVEDGIARINHQWFTQPSYGPDPNGSPHPQPCPEDKVYRPAITYPPLRTECPDCGHIKNWP